MDLRPSLEALQAVKWRRLLEAILPRNRFYARKFAAAGVDARAIGDLRGLSRLPLTTKDELLADHEAEPPYGSALTYDLASYTRMHQTSGSSGEPLAWLDTAESWSAIKRAWRVIYAAAGVGAGERIFFPFSFGPFLGFWAAFEGAQDLGLFCLSGGGLTSVARLRCLIEHRITAVACTPTYALRLAEVAQEEGIDLRAGAVRTLIVAGEPGGSIPECRRRIEEAWGARCVDHWGMTEVGPLAFEPLGRPGGLHLLETHCIAEAVDPETLAPLEGPGRGELVLTTLERSACPVVRYRTGDLVEWPGAAGAASGAAPASFDGVPWDPATGAPFLRLEGGILGRVDQMVTVRGNNVHPAAIEAIVRRFTEIVEYRAEVLRSPSGGRLRLVVEPKGALGAAEAAALAARLARAVQDQLFLRPEVETVPPATLPRFEFKSQRFVVISAGEKP
jgi:phenylacetate-CoA ligase